MDRFKERVNDVKVQLLETFQSLLSATVEIAPTSLDLELASAPSLMRTRSYGGQITEMTEAIVT